MACPNLTDTLFQSEVLDSEQPVLVSFWAPWCNICRSICPRVETLVNRKCSHIQLMRVNVDDYPNLAEQYEVMSVPTILAFKQGIVVQKIVGMPRDLDAQLEVLLADLADQ